jgi:hypothetical protein
MRKENVLMVKRKDNVMIQSVISTNNFMKKQKYTIEKAFQDYKYAFADWNRTMTKARIKDGYYDLKDTKKKIEWNKKFDKKNKKLFDAFDKAEKRFLNMVKPGLFKSYMNYIEEKVNKRLK